jgi:hypothetical protein
MIELLAAVEIRTRRKIKQAEEAYLRQKTIKQASNCQHGGRPLTENISVCKIYCQGEHEAQAGQCWREKAHLCPEFTLKRSEARHRRDFQQIPHEELALRWPSIGELLWVRKQILIELGRDPNDPLPLEDNPTQRQADSVRTQSHRKTRHPDAETPATHPTLGLRNSLLNGRSHQEADRPTDGPISYGQPRRRGSSNEEDTWS